MAVFEIWIFFVGIVSPEGASFFNGGISFLKGGGGGYPKGENLTFLKKKPMPLPPREALQSQMLPLLDDYLHWKKL